MRLGPRIVNIPFFSALLCSFLPQTLSFANMTSGSQSKWWAMKILTPIAQEKSQARDCGKRLWSHFLLVIIFLGIVKLHGRCEEKEGKERREERRERKEILELEIRKQSAGGAHFLGMDKMTYTQSINVLTPD